MLFWEAADPGLGEVHHLMVLCYHLQHPSLYSLDGLVFARHLLFDFIEQGLTPAEVRQRNRDKLDSGKRNWKVKGTSDSQGSYDRPIEWQMTAADVIAGDSHNYIDNVRAWAQSVHEVLKTM